MNKYYQVVRAGLLGDIPPQHESGVVEGQMANNASLKYVATRANAVASITNGSVSSVKLLGFIDRVEVVSKGSGYILQNTTVTATGSGSGAVLIPEIVNGKIEAIYVSSKGSGYDANTTQIVITSTTPVTAASATAIVKFSYGYRTPPSVLIESSPTGFNAEVSLQASKTDAIIEADIDIATGAISKVKIVDGGVGYTFAKLLVSGGGGSQALLEPIVDFGDLTSSQADIQLLAQPGSISGFKVTSAGVNYTTANVEIVGDGTGATAEAHIDENGGIDYIFIKTQGLNYSYAEAIITGDGIGATARVIFAPPLGHGFNPQQELLPRGVGLYAGFSNEAN